MQSIYTVLDGLGILYQKHEHPPVFTVEQAAQYDRGIDVGKSKNLFLRNKKGDTHYLLILESTKRADLEALAKLLQESKISFASPERLEKYLGLKPGSVSPFGLINDTDHVVKVLVDKALMKYETLGYHPNSNTETLVITVDDFKKYLDWIGNSLEYIDV